MLSEHSSEHQGQVYQDRFFPELEANEVKNIIDREAVKKQ